LNVPIGHRRQGGADILLWWNLEETRVTNLIALGENLKLFSAAIANAFWKHRLLVADY